MHARVLGAAVSLFALAGTGIAAAPAANATVGPYSSTHGNIVLPVRIDADGHPFAELPFDWQVGDCVQFKGARISLTPVPDGTQAVLSADMMTQHTNHADIWHATFTFTDSSGNFRIAVRGLDGPRMSETFRTYRVGVASHVNRQVPAEQLAQVFWQADC